MDNMVRIGPNLVPRESIKFVCIDEDKETVIIKVDNDRVALSREEYPEEYELLKRVVDRTPTLASKLAAARAGQWDSEYFDPFLVPLPNMVYRLFQELPNAYELVLSLRADGKGAIFRRDETERRAGSALVAWNSFDEAEQAIEAYKAPLKPGDDIS